MKKLLYIIPILFIGCTTPKEIIREVPVEVIKEVEKKVYVHDTTYTHDSTIIYQKGDTVFKDHIKYIYVGKTVHDTLISHDTVPKPIYNTEIKEVVKNVPQWWPVWLSVGLIAVYLLITKTKFVKLIKDFIKYIILIFK